VRKLRIPWSDIFETILFGKKDFLGQILYKVVDRPKTTIILISPSPTLSTNPRKNLNLSRKIKPNSFSFAAQGGDQKCYSKDEQPDH